MYPCVHILLFYFCQISDFFSFKTSSLKDTLLTRHVVLSGLKFKHYFYVDYTERL